MSALHPSVCPLDCPSTCPLEVSVTENGQIGAIHGAGMPYTNGAICTKVSRYAERVHHPDRILTPLRRIGEKGSGQFEPVSWDDALDITANALIRSAAAGGAESVWPYFYAGTMGLIQRGAINRLRRAMGYSGQQKTICATIAGAGWMAGIGRKIGVDPREIPQSDLIVIWGGNPVATQVHLMGLIQQARKQRGAKLVVIDPYRSGTAEKADLHLMLRPGTDGALACAIMHCLFRDQRIDWDYVNRQTRDVELLRQHVAATDPAWAAAITGLTIAEIEAFADLYGRLPRSFLRVGYGMSRSRNGAVNVHAVTCLPALTGAWQYEGGGACGSLSGNFAISLDVAEGLTIPSPSVRDLDMCQIGAILNGDADALHNGPPVTAMLVQNSNPASVAPDSLSVWRGMARPDLFLAVHEQRMTTTAKFADIVFPATTFLEHADLYTSYGHTFLQVAKPVIPPLGESRSNHWLVCQLAKRLGVDHPSFVLDEWDLIEQTLAQSHLPKAEDLHQQRWLDCSKGFAATHFSDGFGHPDGRFRFLPQWGRDDMPTYPDHWPVIEEGDADHPFRLITPPSRHFLNSSFNDCPDSRRRAGQPQALIHSDDAATLGIQPGQLIRLGNRRGSVTVSALPSMGIARGVVAVEGLWNDADFPNGVGINSLTGAERVAPDGGGAFHDSAIWIRTDHD